MRSFALWSLVLGPVVFACVGSDPVAGGGADSGAPALDASVAPPPDSGGPDASREDSGGPPVDAATPDAAPACGAPGTPCCAGAACSGGSTCNAGTCACAADKTTCGSACVDTLADPLNCGRCGHDCVGGACTGGKCQAITLSTGHTNVSDMVSEGGRLYFTRSGNNFITGGLFSVKLDGTDLKPHHEVGQNQVCGGAAVAKGKLYFLCTGGATRRLLSCDLPACAGTPAIVRDNLGPVARGVAADPASGKVFTLTGTVYNQSTGGGVFDSTGAQVGAINQPNPSAIRVAGGFLYWMNAGTYAADSPQKNGGVRRIAVAGGPQADVIGANNIYFDNQALSVDAVSVYYTGRNSITNKSDVLVGPIAGGGLSVFAADLQVSTVASDGTQVFFDDNLTDTLFYCPRAAGCGGGKLTLATGEDGVADMVLDDKSVIWARNNGDLRRIAKP